MSEVTLLSPQRELSHVFDDKNSALKKLARLSISSDVNSLESLDMDDFSSQDEHTLSNSNFSRATPISTTVTNQSHQRNESQQSLRSRESGNKKHNARGSNAGSISKKGEIVSFYAKRRDSEHSEQTAQPAKSSSQNKEQVVLLETNDPEFFYSLSAKDKFGRMFEMSELNDKVVLVRLDKKTPLEKIQSVEQEYEKESSQQTSQVEATKSQASLAPKNKQKLLVMTKKQPQAAPKIVTPTKFLLPKVADPNFFYNIQIEDKFGKPFPMSSWKGKVLLIVNSASKCKLASQLSELQKLYEKYHDQGLEILLLPCAQFGKDQELKDENQILQFCKVNYGVGFPIMKKIKVNGPEEHLLYAYLKQFKRKYFGLKRVSWNYEKFLIDREGNIVKRLPSFIKPRKLVPLIEQCLLQS